MNVVQHIVCDPANVACKPAGTGWEGVTGDAPDTIVDHYKGMEIQVRARRFGIHAWRCRIRIGITRHRASFSIMITLLETKEGISRQSALSSAFIEAMNLCDLLMDKLQPT